MSFGFLRKFGPSIRYHNPHLTVERVCEESGPPVFRFEVYKREVGDPIVIPVDKKEKVQ